MTLTDLLGNDDAHWMSTPGRPCASPINSPLHIRDYADGGWFPHERSYNPSICDGCPVITQCLQYALDNQEEHGIWGGTTPQDRARLLADAGAA